MHPRRGITGNCTRHPLTGETRAGAYSYAASYAYDHNGNRLSKTLNGATDTYAYFPNSDRLASTTGSAGTGAARGYAYDANGNVTGVTVGGQTANLIWDDADRLTFVNGSVYQDYRYNGLGERLGKDDSAGTARYLFDGADPGSALMADNFATYTPGLSEGRTGYGVHYLVPDVLGSTRNLTDAGASAWTDSLLYDAFGVTLDHSGAGTPVPLGYVGDESYQTDRDTGWMLLGRRYYDPSTGRFLSQDPAGDGDNWYAYADNDPTGETDPTGLSPESDEMARNDPAYDGQTLHSAGDDTTWFNDADGNVHGFTPVHLAGPDNSGWNGGHGSGFGNWVDQHLMFGTAANLGMKVGFHDGGYASGKQVAVAGAEAFGMGLVNAIPVGRAAAWANAGFPLLTIKAGLLGRDLHFIYGVGDEFAHALHEVGTIYRVQAVSAPMARLYKPLISIKIPITNPGAAMQLGGTAKDCLYAALAAARRGIFGR